MMNIKKNHLIFLIEKINDTDIKKKLQQSLLDFGKNKKNSSLDFSKEEIDHLIDELTILFTQKGIEKDFEPNELGLMVEDIIDVLTKSNP